MYIINTIPHGKCWRTVFTHSLFSYQKSFIYNIHIYTVPQVNSKTICFSSVTYISTVLDGLHQGEWPLQASHTISDLWYDQLGPGTRTLSTAVFRYFSMYIINTIPHGKCWRTVFTHSLFLYQKSFIYNSGALAREERSGAPWVKKCGKLPIRENLAIT